MGWRWVWNPKGKGKGTGTSTGAGRANNATWSNTNNATGGNAGTGNATWSNDGTNNATWSNAGTHNATWTNDGTNNATWDSSGGARDGGWTSNNRGGLQDILSDKKSPLNVSEIQACKDILKAHRARTEDSNPSEAVSRNVAAANLEKEELDILLKQMERDLKTYALWQLKCEDREAAMYHAELAQKTSRHQAIRRNARDLLDMKSPEWRASINVLEKPETAYSDIRHSVQSLSKLFHCPSSDVAVVTLCNWSASVSKAQTQKNQASVMGACINDSTAPLNIGLMLQPAMSSKRGSLWKEEEAARKVLANSNLNMDTCFCIVFDSKVDLREMRPGDFLITLSLCWGIF